MTNAILLCRAPAAASASALVSMAFAQNTPSQAPNIPESASPNIPPTAGLGVEAVDVLQTDATRCGGVTGFLAAAAVCDGAAVPDNDMLSPDRSRLGLGIEFRKQDAQCYRS